MRRIDQHRVKEPDLKYDVLAVTDDNDANNLEHYFIGKAYREYKSKVRNILGWGWMSGDTEFEE